DRKKTRGEHRFARQPRGAKTGERAPGVGRIGEMQYRGGEPGGEEHQPEQRSAPERMRREASGRREVGERDQREQSQTRPRADGEEDDAERGLHRALRIAGALTFEWPGSRGSPVLARAAPSSRPDP